MTLDADFVPDDAPMSAARILLLELSELKDCASAQAILDGDVQTHRERVGAAIRLLRAERDKMTLRTLAKLANVSASFLSDLELGRRWSDAVVSDIRHILIPDVAEPEGET